jgi:hypothetical protein
MELRDNVAKPQVSRDSNDNGGAALVGGNSSVALVS